MIDKSTYAIFNNSKNKSLVFYQCPKNANSSAKLFFAKHIGVDQKLFFIEDKIPRHCVKEHKALESQHKDKINLINFFPNYQKFGKVNCDIKCCITRNPLKRFVSSYKNRILFHKDKSFFNLSINEILEKLEDGLFENRHFLTQTFFLGNDLDYYDFAIDISNAKLFEAKINNFFGKEVLFPHIQTGGKEFEVELNIDQINKVKQIYSEDYELLRLTNSNNFISFS